MSPFHIPSLLSLLTLLATFATAQQYIISGLINSPPCLDPVEASLIALRWLQIFNTDSTGAGTGSAIISSTLAPNFTYWDEGASFGQASPVYTSAQDVYQSVTGTGYSGTLVTDVQYSVVFSFASCDIVLCRWASNSKAANGTGVTVPVGTPIQYLGSDYLQVDLTTRLIYNVTSSSDLVNYYIQLGDDVIASKLNSTHSSRRRR